MIIKINTKGDYLADIGDENGALNAFSDGNDTKKELEKAMIEINLFLSKRIEEITESEE